MNYRLGEQPKNQESHWLHSVYVTQRQTLISLEGFKRCLDKVRESKLCKK